jgi:hypothetical protein
MIPAGFIYTLNHNDDGSVTVGFRNETKTYSNKDDIAAIVKRNKEQRERQKDTPMSFPSLLA